MKKFLNNDYLLIGNIIASISILVVAHLFIHVFPAYYDSCYCSEIYSLPSPMVKVEYYVEIDRDSVFVQNMYGDVYSGKLCELDSIIVYDNL